MRTRFVHVLPFFFAIPLLSQTQTTTSQARPAAPQNLKATSSNPATTGQTLKTAPNSNSSSAKPNVNTRLTAAPVPETKKLQQKATNVAAKGSGTPGAGAGTTAKPQGYMAGVINGHINGDARAPSQNGKTSGIRYGQGSGGVVDTKGTTQTGAKSSATKK